MKNKKNQIKKAAKFFASIVIIYAIIWIALLLLVGIKPFQEITAIMSNAALSAIGEPAKLSFTDLTLMTFKNGIKIEINDLCTGLIEIIILIAAILSTVEIKLEKRIIGVIAGILFGITINILRITITTMNLLKTNIDYAILTHDVFFRISLFIVIAGFYWAWLQLVMKKIII